MKNEEYHQKIEQLEQKEKYGHQDIAKVRNELDAEKKLHAAEKTAHEQTQLRLEQAQEQLETSTQRIAHHHDVVRQLGASWDQIRFSGPEAEEQETSAPSIEIKSSDDIMNNLKDLHQAIYRKLFGLKGTFEVKKKDLEKEKVKVIEVLAQLTKAQEDQINLKSEFQAKLRKAEEDNKKSTIDF